MEVKENIEVIKKEYSQKCSQCEKVITSSKTPKHLLNMLKNHKRFMHYDGTFRADPSIRKEAKEKTNRDSQIVAMTIEFTNRGLL